MKRIMILLCCLAAVPVAAQASDLFRWVDSAGKIYYGDTPPANALEVQSIKSSGSASQTDDLPYETRIAQRNFPVTLYVGSGIPFAEKVLKTSKDIAAYKQLSGMDAFVPALQVGTTFIKGFQESQWNNELDIAGYAKTASYRQRLQQQSPPPIPETPPADADQDFSAESAVQ
jgi:hypothetical protein